MNINPLSPFTNTPLSDCDNRELDAWAAKLCGWEAYMWCHPYGEGLCFMNTPDGRAEDWPHYTATWAAAGPLMEQDEWPLAWGLFVDANGASIWDNDNVITNENSAPLAITLAFIIAAEHAKENHDATE